MIKTCKNLRAEMNAPSNAVATPEHPPVEAQRIKAFATFFKSYMSVSAIVIAALPIPITKLRLIPMYKTQANLYSTYTSLFCFLVLGFVFYSRHSIARWMFPEYIGAKKHMGHSVIAILPLILLVPISSLCVSLPVDA